MLAQEISIPVYFSKYDTDLDDIISDISKLKVDEEDDDLADVKGKRDSALSEIINSISANGYQVCIKTLSKWSSIFDFILLFGRKKGSSERSSSFAE